MDLAVPRVRTGVRRVARLVAAVLVVTAAWLALTLRTAPTELPAPVPARV